MFIQKNRQLKGLAPLEMLANCDLTISLELSANSNLGFSTKIWTAFLTGRAWWWTLFWR